MIYFIELVDEIKSLESLQVTIRLHGGERMCFRKVTDNCDNVFHPIFGLFIHKKRINPYEMYILYCKETNFPTIFLMKA